VNKLGIQTVAPKLYKGKYATVIAAMAQAPRQYRDKIATMKTWRSTLTSLFLIVLSSTGSWAAEPPIQALPDHGVVLMYHRFGENRYPATNVRLAQFEAQLNHLETAGYQIWPLTRLVAQLAADTPIPDRVVVITVDDAYGSIYTEAYPRLKAKGWPFTVFIATNGVDRGFDAFLNWEQMREMAQHGVTFANHGTSHDHLTKKIHGETEATWLVRIESDITHAQQRIRDELGEAPMLFAYPYGEYNLALAALLQRLGYTAFGQHSGAIGRHASPHTLPRFPVSEHYANGSDFEMKVATLPLPVTAVNPMAPTLADTDNPPTLTVTVPADAARIPWLNCFASDQGQIPLTWLNRAEQRFSVAAPKPLTGARSRYNCTAPSPVKGRFYWYSHPWFQ